MNQNNSDTPSGSVEVATLGGGCFWCTEAVFTSVQGVVKVESGYAGGSIENPTYEQVSTGRTGHTEVVQITFNPRVVAFRELLEIFFATHDPTTLNRQGADVGTQYRSAIFYHGEDQRETAESLINELNAKKIWNAPIVTQITPFTAFYKAEGYHMKYYEQHGNQPYCRLVIDPKLEKLRKQFKAQLK
jgi:peptide-methionine (S)-S-oxide reductase